MKLSQSLREDFLSELQLCISMTAVLSIAMDTSPDSHVRKIGDTHTHTVPVNLQTQTLQCESMSPLHPSLCLLPPATREEDLQM